MNIEKHKFFDDDISDVCAMQHQKRDNGFVEINSEASTIHLNKDDSIALAKHFKLTAEDINDKTPS